MAETKQKAEKTLTNNSQIGGLTVLPLANFNKCHDQQRSICYLYSPEYVTMCDQLQRVCGRASLIHSLIDAYHLLPHLTILSPKPATSEELQNFHTVEYVSCLAEISKQDDVEKYDEEAENFGLCYDCPAFPGVYDYAAYVSGATIQAALALNKGKCTVAINWCGGWHHAKRDEASGFCYLNDIVLGILKLREKFERILYIDLDLHHGDGVEDAFCATQRVLTWSIHKHSPGFFPGSGAIDDIGLGKGKYFTVNTPLQDGIRDGPFYRIFQRIACKLKEQFNPCAVVCQCGADSLATDPMKAFNLTPKVYGDCIKYILKWNLPTLLLGGGGYNLSDTAKCWTYLTSIIVGTEIPSEIPEHDYFTHYGPDYSIEVTPGNRVDANTEQYIDALLSECIENLDKVIVH